MHDINVTPFIDVMLVLLIIFMVAAPLATVDMPVELPVLDGATAAAARQAGLSDGQGGLQPGASATSRSGATASRRTRQRDQGEQGSAHLPARRPRRALRRPHERDERSARGRLSQGGLGRAGIAGGEMTHSAFIMVGG